MKEKQNTEQIKTLQNLKRLTKKIYGLSWVFGTAKEKTQMIETVTEFIVEIKKGKIRC